MLLWLQFLGFGIMAKLKFLFDLILVIFFLLIGLAFAFRNDAVVPLDFIVYRIDSMHLGFLVTLSFCLGGVLGLLVRLPGMFKMRLTQRHHQRKLERQENEILRLKGESVKGS